MPRVAKELTDKAVRSLDRPGFHAVGGVPGLLLQIPGKWGAKDLESVRSESDRKVLKEVPNLNARSWVLRATIAGRVRMAGLGPYPEVTLAQARVKAKEMREAIREGRDPIAERKAAKRALALEQAKRITFKEAAKRVHAKKAAEYRSEGHVHDWLRSLEDYAFPHIGDMPVGEIELVHVLKVLQPIWTTKSGGTADNVRRRMESVFTWATVSGYRQSDNPARWVGNLKEVLASPTKIHKTKHREALPWQQAPTFMQALRERDNTPAKALEFIILTATRYSETAFARWDEIDLDRKRWTIPPERIKMGEQHRVPLSDDVVSLLKGIDRIKNEPLVFATKRGKPVTDGRVLSTARSILPEYDNITVHGFRSTFRDWAAERTNFPRDIAEMALAHAVKSEVEKAYWRSDAMQKRALMMQAWANFLREPVQAGEVVPIGKAAS